MKLLEIVMFYINPYCKFYMLNVNYLIWSVSGVEFARSLVTKMRTTFTRKMKFA